MVSTIYSHPQNAGHRQRIQKIGLSFKEFGRNLIDILRESKLEIKERLKMERHYGMLRSPLAQLKTAYPTFLASKNIKTWAKDKGNSQSQVISDELKARLEKISDLNKIKKGLYNNPPSVTFVSYTIPRLDSTSSDVRLFHILQILLKNQCKIDFLYCVRLWNDTKYAKRFKGDISFKYLPLNLQDYVKFVAKKSPQYVWITELWRIPYVKFMAELSEHVREQCPVYSLIVDTIDFHFKEFYRKYELTRNPEDLERANQFLKHEKVLYRAADIVVVISEDEQRDIKSKISNIKKIEIIPNIHEVSHSVYPYPKRRNMCFVGHFGNKHNVDAATYFIKNIFQFILEKNPNVEFHILGYFSDKYKSTFRSPNVKAIGGLKYLEEALKHYKLFVCPMTYGAGMKGKIGGAISAGIPVVTTTIGAEGFPFTDGEECFIADSSTEFAEKCNRCLEDPVLWHNFSINSRLMLAENYSPGVVAEKLTKIMANN